MSLNLILALIGSGALAVAAAWLHAHFTYRRLDRESSEAEAALIKETHEQIERLKNETTRDSELFIEAKAKYQAKLLDYRNRFGRPPGSGDDGASS